jgi:hypothetical protein
MIKQISHPMAHAVVTWVPPESGGRRSGPPSAKVYAATATFVMGDDAEVLPGWPARAEQLSIMLEKTEDKPCKPHKYKLDFIARDIARQFIHPGAELLIMEGPKVVANAFITDVVDAARGNTRRLSL